MTPANLIDCIFSAEWALEMFGRINAIWFDRLDLLHPVGHLSLNLWQLTVSFLSVKYQLNQFVLRKSLFAFFIISISRFLEVLEHVIEVFVTLCELRQPLFTLYLDTFQVEPDCLHMKAFDPL